MSLTYHIKRIIRRIVTSSIPEICYLESINESGMNSWIYDSEVSANAKLYPVYHVNNSKIGDFTYIANNSSISMTEIGKFCSIGPNLLCGWGIHPLNGISTAPMFYSTMKQNGMTLSSEDKVAERRPIKIGNDVFIGANVTILDGVTIGDGAVIGAGAVVSKDIPPYAVAVGVPIRILHYRFNEDVRKRLLKMEWWNFCSEELQDVEHYFLDVESFLEKHECSKIK
jgi:acetyltransferase-like isoleucine patch superfamily enzyme